MADEKRNLILDLLSRDKTGGAPEAVSRKLGKVGSAADAAEKDIDKMSKTTVIAGETVEKMGKEAADAQDKVRHLDREIGKLNQDLVLMAGAMATAATAAERADFSKGIRKTQADIRKLEQGKGILGNLIPKPTEIIKPAQDAGGTAGAGLLAGLKSKLGAGGGALVPILAGAAIGAAPIIGATIAAGIIGGAGGAGILGGVLLASKSSEVKRAGQDLGASVFAEAYMMARRHFIAPTLDSIGLIRRGWGQMSGDVDRLFASTSKHLPQLTSGVISAVDSVIRGIADAAEGFGPITDALSTGVAGIGDAIGDVFSDLKDNGVDAATALIAVLRIVENTIRVVGVLVNGLTESFGFLAKIGAFGQGIQQEYIRLDANAKIAAASGKDVATGLGSVRSAGQAAAAAIGKLKDEIGDLTEANRTLYGSQVDVAQALADTKKVLDENGEGLNLNTEKGRENRKALLTLAEAMVREKDAVIALNGEGEKANGVMDRNQARFIAMAEKAGYSRKEAKRLADQLLGIPSVSPSVNVRGIPKAKSDIEKLKERLAGIKDRTVYVHVAMVEGRKISVNKRLDRIGARASGGPTVRGGRYIVGEHGPEILETDEPGRVFSAASSRGLVPTAAARAVSRSTTPSRTPASSMGGGWAGPMSARLEVVGPEELRVFLRKIIRTLDIIPGYQASQNSWTAAA
jgi:hypothetical protein